VKAVKIIGLIALILWMAWATKELMDIKFIAIETCGLITSKVVEGGIHMPVVCPDLMDSEARRQNSN
jgi:hypothetical protein